MARRARKKKWIAGALKTKRRRLGVGRHHRKSVRVEALHKGALHRYLGVPKGQKIPTERLVKVKHDLEVKFVKSVLGGRKAHPSTVHHLRQINFALTARKFFKRKKKSFGRKPR